MIRLLVLLLFVGLTSCATLKADRAPGCSGGRRSANPHGSVLAPEATQPAAAGGGECLGGRP